MVGQDRHGESIFCDGYDEWELQQFSNEFVGTDETIGTSETGGTDETTYNGLKDLIWINDGTVNHRIRSRELQLFLHNGWKKGRINNNTWRNEKYVQYCNLIKSGMSVIDAGQKLGVSRTTLWRWCNKK